MSKERDESTCMWVTLLAIILALGIHVYYTATTRKLLEKSYKEGFEAGKEFYLHSRVPLYKGSVIPLDAPEIPKD